MFMCYLQVLGAEYHMDFFFPFHFDFCFLLGISALLCAFIWYVFLAYVIFTLSSRSLMLLHACFIPCVLYIALSAC